MKDLGFVWIELYLQKKLRSYRPSIYFAFKYLCILCLLVEKEEYEICWLLAPWNYCMIFFVPCVSEDESSIICAAVLKSVCYCKDE